ncbi:MAG: hypothetical protein GF381_01280 [Candidatus Pacebacteria bacterium]|nr:hypothetical protein [Candidatus Paceibacterota bacterium]
MNKKGFTLIEILVVSGLSIVLILTATSLFATFMASSSQTRIQQQLKQEGSQALSQMEYLLRNAKTISTNMAGQVCQENMSSLGFESFAGGKGILYQDGARIASDSAVLGQEGSTTKTYFLTSQQVVIPEDSSLEFDCYSSPGTESQSYFINISFSLANDTETSLLNRSMTQDYSRGVQLRNLTQN